MGVGIEGKDGDGLSGEKLSLFSRSDDDCVVWFRARCRNPRRELSFAPSQSHRPRTTHHAIDRLDDLPGRPEDSLQTISADVCQAQLSGLNDRADFVQRRQQAGEAFVVMHRVGFAEPERGAEPDCLAHRHPRPHPGVARERGDLPQLAAQVGGEQGGGMGDEPLPARLFTPEWKEGNPDAGGERARWTLRH